MTLIELGVVMSIVTVMLALVLGLGRHVNEAIKYRRAQADLGEWHETLNAWYLKYGMYPDPSAPPFNCKLESNLTWLASTNSSLNQQYYVPLSDGTRYPFCALASKHLQATDTWRTVYFYQSFTNSYVLFSCGPNRVHRLDDGSIFPPTASATDRNATDPNADDVYFEP